MIMSQILLLTNNPLNEQIFENQLRQLGHEVFTSKVLVDVCLFKNENSDFIRVFDHIIFSETISNAEVIELASGLKNYAIPLFRKSDERLDENEFEDWKGHGITEWIENQPSIEGLRERLSCNKLRSNGKVVFLQTSDKKRSISSFSLSSGEMKLFRILYDQKKKIVSREEICLLIWNKQKSNSSMSQLSVMVKHLKNKLAAQNIGGPIMETCWGQGYRLHESVYEQVYIEVEEKKYGIE